MMREKVAMFLIFCMLILGIAHCVFAVESEDQRKVLITGGNAIEGIITFCGFLPSRALDDVQVAIVGVPLDQGTTNRSGTRFGPRAVRIASQIYRLVFEQGKGIYNIELGRYLLNGVKMVDYGDIYILPTLTESNMKMITDGIKEILDKKVFPVIIGGDHSISFPIVQAYGDMPMDIIHFDTHLDFFDDYMGVGMRYSHGNPIKRISELSNVGKITQIGIRGLENSKFMVDEANKRGSNIITADKIHKNGVKWTIARIPSAKNIYVTIDIDVLDPSVAPGTGTPEFGGLSYLQLVEVLRALPEKGNIIGFDIVEVNPLYDSGEITAQTAARLMLDLADAVMEKKVTIDK